MKKILFFLVIFSLLLASTACDLFPTIPVITTTTQATTATTSATTVGTTSQSATTATTAALQTTTLPVTTTTTPTTAVTTTTTATTTVTTAMTTSATTAATTLPAAQPFIPSGYSLLQDELDWIGIPATGEVKLLVFVIDFSDATLAQSGVTLAMIDKAFNGATDETVYESLRSYYDKSSFGKLSLSADIYTYRAPQTTAYYEDDYIDYYTDSDLIYDMMLYYNNVIDYSDYDANGDGFVDGIYVIYTAPVSYYSGSDLWWAYQDYYIYEGDTFDGVEPLYFCWSGTDFIIEAGPGTVDAHTLIHETGHMLGLDDYYDYDDSDPFNAGGLGGADMMDDCAGDHSSISKLLLGWITPLVVTESMTVDIGPYVQAGETLLIIDEWNDTIFDEYLLISYYTPTGLNEYDAWKLFTIPGILIYHVDARIGNGYLEDSSYWTIFNYNNTDTFHKFVKIIEADEDGTIPLTWYSADDDLFQAGDVFRVSVEAGYDWYQTLKPDMDFIVAIVSLDAAGAIITITFDEQYLP